MKMHNDAWVNFGIEDENSGEEIADITIGLSDDESRIILSINNIMLPLSKSDVELLSRTLLSIADDVVEKDNV